MKKTILTLFAAISLVVTDGANAQLSGSTYTMNSAFSLCITNANVTISNVVAGLVNVSTLIISNSANSSIEILWTAAGRAVGFETTNRVVLPAAEVVEIKVNAVFPGLVTYTTRLQYPMPSIFVSTNDNIPDLLYYKLTEGFGSTIPPVLLADSSSHGGTTGHVNSTVPITWDPDQGGSPNAAIYFDGISTSLDTENNTLFNFTTNLFSINIWVRPLEYNPIFIGNGTWANTGWFFGLNGYGAAVMVANSPGAGTYVGTAPYCATLGQWCMFTVVRTNTSTILIYKNAVLQATSGSFADPSPCTDTVVLGDYHGGGIHYNGDMGVVSVYGRPLSAAEIGTLYTNSVSQ
jgi:Concanavalin A-like lectin/glucanases superfamily